MRFLIGFVQVHWTFKWTFPFVLQSMQSLTTMIVDCWFFFIWQNFHFNIILRRFQWKWNETQHYWIDEYFSSFRKLNKWLCLVSIWYAILFLHYYKKKFLPNYDVLTRMANAKSLVTSSMKPIPFCMHSILCYNLCRYPSHHSMFNLQ